MQRRHRNFHAKLWPILAILLPLLVVGSLLIRNRLPLKAPAVLLVPPGEGVPK